MGRMLSGSVGYLGAWHPCRQVWGVGTDMAVNEDNCATKLKVLADDTRLAVVRQLMHGPLQVNELNAHLNLDQSLLSHHLRVLRDAGIVRSERQGKAVLYRLSEQVAPGATPGRSINLGCCNLSFDPGK